MRRCRPAPHFYSCPYARGDPLSACARGRRDISTRAPTRGATVYKYAKAVAANKFLLTPLREGRHRAELRERVPHDISTHAPTREATNGGSGGSPHVGISTHAPTREATQLCVFYVIIQIISTHAPTREATRARSRARAGGAISTHAPTREATRQSPTLSRRTSNFYSRPYARGDSNFSQNHKLIYMINC